MAKFTSAIIAFLVFIYQQVVMCVVLPLVYKSEIKRGFNEELMYAHIFLTFSPWYVLCVVGALYAYNEPSDYYMRSLPKNFKYYFWTWKIMAGLWFVAIAVHFIIFSFKLALLNGCTLITTVFVTLLMSYKLSQQKQKFEQFIENAIALNSTNGRHMTFDQAYIFYKLHNYRTFLAWAQKKREARKNLGRPYGTFQSRATSFDGYFQLAHWIHGLEQQEKSNEFQQKLLGEMQERLEIYALLAEERRLLSELAEWDKLQVPEMKLCYSEVVVALNAEKV